MRKEYTTTSCQVWEMIEMDLLKYVENKMSSLDVALEGTWFAV